jgi:hypothetical protein
MKRHNIRDKKTGRFIPKKEKASYAGVYTVRESKPSKKVEEAVRILKALYGVEGNLVEIENVRIGKKASNRMAGFDPVPGQKKIMVIEAEIKGKKITKTFNEGSVVEF